LIIEKTQLKQSFRFTTSATSNSAKIKLTLAQRKIFIKKPYEK